jgi:hypothetical protein
MRVWLQIREFHLAIVEREAAIYQKKTQIVSSALSVYSICCMKNEYACGTVTNCISNYLVD